MRNPFQPSERPGIQDLFIALIYLSFIGCVYLSFIGFACKLVSDWVHDVPYVIHGTDKPPIRQRL